MNEASASSLVKVLSKIVDSKIEKSKKKTVTAKVIFSSTSTATLTEYTSNLSN